MVRCQTGVVRSRFQILLVTPHILAFLDLRGLSDACAHTFPMKDNFLKFVIIHEMNRSRQSKRKYVNGQFVRPKWHLAIFNEERGRLLDFDGNAIKVFPAGEARAWIKSEACPTWKSCRPATFNVRERYTVEQLQRFIAEPESRIRRMPLTKRRAVARYRYLLTFGPEVVHRVAASDPSVSWGMLNCLSRIPQAVDIYDHSPAFLVLAYYHWTFRRKKTKSSDFSLTRRFIRRPQRELCDYLHLGDGNSVPRIFRKIPREYISMETVWCTGCALVKRDRLSYALRHVASVTPDIAHMVADPAVRGFCTSALLHEVGLSAANDGIYGTLRDMRRMREMLGDESHRQFFSTRALGRYHDELVYRMNEQEMGKGPDRSFPAPPIQERNVPTPDGDVEIQYLATSRALCLHGREQQNCVASRICEVARGELPIYAIRSSFGDMHTVSISRRNGGWELAELRGPHNARADARIARAVARWLGSETAVQQGIVEIPAETWAETDDSYLPF